MIACKCKGCTERHEGCHAGCQAYKDYLCEKEKAKAYNKSFKVVCPSEFGCNRRKGGKLANVGYREE